jgi:hypothetical protein
LVDDVLAVDGVVVVTGTIAISGDLRRALPLGRIDDFAGGAPPVAGARVAAAARASRRGA